ncbi:MAG TPA: transposase [Candidatus Binataceae bacterium]|nr:transposase [Candidatus Binataceae bacterium]
MACTLPALQVEVESVAKRRRKNDGQPVRRGANHRDPARAESGSEDQEVGRRHGISEAIFYKWKAKCSGLDVSEARWLKSLEDENRRLKKLLPRPCLDNAARLSTCSEKTLNTCGATGGHRTALIE